jgi:chromosome partitioning protein
MFVITTAVIKGGTGKSTTSAALAQAAQFKKKRALLIDLDPQGNSSRFVAANDRQAGCFELLTGRASIEDVVQETPQGLSAIVASKDLSTIGTSSGSAFTLRDALKPIQDRFDYAFIDTPPSIGALTLNALAASDALLIPMETDAGSIHGLHYIGELVNAVHEANPALSIIGVFVTRYDGRPKINQTLKAVIADRAADYGAHFFGCIRNGIAVREAQALRQSLFTYNKASNPAKDYIALFDLIKKERSK